MDDWEGSTTTIYHNYICVQGFKEILKWRDEYILLIRLIYVNLVTVKNFYYTKPAPTT